MALKSFKCCKFALGWKCCSVKVFVNHEVSETSEQKSSLCLEREYNCNELFFVSLKVLCKSQWKYGFGI